MAATRQRPTKLTPPRMRGVLERERLYAALDAAAKQRALVWLSGPAGAGKTTLAAAWLAARKRRAVWLQLDAGDADPASFFHYFAAAAQLVAPRRNLRLPPLTADLLPALPTFARNFARRLFETLPADTICVLDNYQDIGEETSVHALLVTIVREAPEGMPIVALSRSAPPPAIAPLVVGGKMSEISWDALRVTLEETSCLARVCGVAATDAERWHAEADGWMAGLVLLIERRALAPAMSGERSECRDAMFQYFAAEVLARAGPEERHFLLASSVLDEIDPRIAARITGEPDAPRLLADLAWRNHFTTRHASTDLSYQYHPLFLDFLRRTAERELGAQAYAAVQVRAAEALEAADAFEAAAALYVRCADWVSVERMVAVLGPTLLAQSRLAVVRRWCAVTPAPVLRELPWLAYWRAMAIANVDPGVGIEALEAAGRAFRARADAVGEYLCWAAITFARVSLRQYDRLASTLEALDELRSRAPMPRELPVLTQIVAAAYTIMVLSAPERADFGEWENEAVQLARLDAAPLDARLANAVAVLYRESWCGAIQQNSGDLVRMLDVVVHPRVTSPLQLISWYSLLSQYHHQTTPDPSACLDASRTAQSLIEEHGLHFESSNSVSAEILLDIEEGDLTSANELLPRFERAFAFPGPYFEAFRHFMLAYYHWRQAPGAGQALKHARAAYAAAANMGVHHSLLWGSLALARVHAAGGAFAEARHWLARLRLLGRQARLPRFETICRIVSALIAQDRGQERRAAALLKRGFAGLAHERLVRLPFFHRDDFARLCAMALRHDIEPDYARWLVRARQLGAPHDMDLSRWPWPVEVRCLGPFEARVDGKLLVFARKSPRKPLDLLKALIAFGGTEVTEDKLIDALWRDEEGDAAAHALAMTVHRLRKLLGERTIIHSDRRLSLDPERVWVDARVFATSTGEAALTLYRGHFLDGEQEIWGVAQREQLRARFLRLTVARGRELEEEKRWRDAAVFYERALEIDALAEELYQGAIRSYAGLGLTSEAVRAWRRCERMLSAEFGMRPSTASQAAYQSVAGY